MTDHTQMLYDINKLNNLFEESSIEQFLQKTVNMVAEHMMATVCSIYIYNELDGKLTLKATKGLNQNSVNTLSIELGEGLAGTSLMECRIICEERGRNNPKFKYYPETGEQDTDSFLIAPIIRGIYRIGVLMVQRDGENHFNEHDITAINAATSQLGSMLEHVKHIIQPAYIKNTSPSTFKPDAFHSFSGKTASQGFVRAPILVKPADNKPEIIAADLYGKKFSIKDFETALKKTSKRLEFLQNQIELKLADAASLIFASHLLMLKDKNFTGTMRQLIESGEDVVNSIMDVFFKYTKIFADSANPLIKEKEQDIADITSEILRNLGSNNGSKQIYQDHIVIARELFPSELLTLSVEDVAGIVLVSGGVTSHVGILARSLMIPLIFINDAVITNIPDGTDALIDADLGVLYINPTDEILKNLEIRLAPKHLNDSNKTKSPKKAVTKDGTEISVTLNINLISDLRQVSVQDIDGVGLYRTEFPFMIRAGFPSEEEQYVIYKKLADGISGKPVVFRTLDIGGDKALAYYDFPKENNPVLGMRSIRFSLEHMDIFKQQIRAILRAGFGANLKIMFPMISSLDEFLLAKDIVMQCIQELETSDIEHNNKPLIGMMVEVPSLIPIVDDLAAETDFFSVGTNDLIQYTLAVDRTNEKVASFYIPHHPAILRAMKTLADAANNAKTELSVCGDMANMEKYIPFLLGIGITNLSVDAIYIPRVKEAIREINISDAKEIAAHLLSLKRISDIENFLNEHNKNKIR